ncbi:MAG: SH3 domain-containing protein [Pseudomonadota bacterium]|nr:SH3 domain-containing protein [Pseudomonadota bacterium]MEE3100088.1 SH3 domain-containing protein [Pseudomonadota bacterium]
MTSRAPDLGPEPAGDPVRTTGPVTDLPLPRFVSLKAAQANVRRGPGMTHRVDWVFVRKGMPLEVIAEYGHWRRVRDQEGGFGWVHYSMLSGVRTALVTPVEADLRETASTAAPVVARAAPGVVLKVEACERDWCEVYKDGVEGWLPKTALWGVSKDETFD